MLGKKKTITVSLSAFGLAREHFESGTYELKQGAKVKTLLRKARLPGDPPEFVFMIEGRRVNSSRKLNNGEDLKVLHAAYGG